MSIRNRLIQLSLIKRGNWFLMYEVLRKDPKLTQIRWEGIENSLVNFSSVKIVTIVDEEYPTCFKQLEMPPFVIYYQGDLNLIRQKKIGIMGTNRPSTYGMKACKMLVSQLMSDNVIIVGGLDLGIDAIAHHVSLRKGRNIAVLASGFDRIYPPENLQLYRNMAKEQLVLSEFPPGVALGKQHFYLRNRLITALSDILMIIEATKEGRVTQVARKALYAGKTIYALPGEYNSIYSEGSLDLIKEGANCLTDYRDILDELKLVSGEELNKKTGDA